ncbi:2Fe-2S iron-sulfur cluster-binding protein [Pelagibacterium halotolerans]|uniref:2-polyprenylphenol hydroxylase and related flavodoxin oxidoreductases / CDP-6-deoxy-delta-3,4-glucoseen reductase-like protein n=1 Tax=Pelagibacterium halotolerans (strain DSM 22347 / JCM 15775 / CGMCC 1.7692 / B2) TaxID=1082931 RepID=G4RBH0_PELHB|nr:2Fe-2S iron-sulfur cluster-binding protein [Pelagibacterium halotolerans]AEQ52646.1 2-polyprenylphenol hydroxylase and related flavodoxin oxidoreductases / CDP-6-deoxy-delta-3,4-glucoseen reductase-like protein [Pelagibacterium halotolerans B2]QJR17650.1 2Fe-2S iron-sulfur cluster binding domain-containing protein [Pelagibacterium halotolerans]SEA83746.1 CDP-4-dehydro-6-deoxyglucose reductase/3-phenylpropionate/trans-cinnamate dioxygenase ferredoxin reductase subunit [Pelagibacterium halotole
MSFRITVTDHDDIGFDCEEDETVLDAADRAGYAIPYSCRKGVCSSCRGGIAAGEAMVRGQGHQTGPAEEVLLCQARPLSDLEITPARIQKVEPVQRKILDAKVRKIVRPAPDVAVIHVRLPIGQRAPFRAGQYLRVMMEDDDSRNYSMANPPQKNDGIELHIRHVPGGKFSEQVLGTMEKGTVLRVELPYGEFCLSDEDGMDAVLLATGTGFAPIKSLIENQIALGAERPLKLYWGVNTEADLYMGDVAEQWAKTYSWITFIPVISSPSQDWQGRTGFVHQAVLEDIADMSNVEVYACGAPVMIDAARLEFVAKAGLAKDRFFSDAFVASGEAP